MENLTTNGFAHMSLPRLLAKAGFIISEMTKNAAIFTDPDPLLASVQTGLTNLELAAKAAEHGDRVAIADRNQKKAILVGLLRKLGIYVNLVANGDRAIAMKSGFNLARVKAPLPPISFVLPPVLSAGVSPGELNSKIKKVKGAKLYTYCISLDPNAPVSEWTSFTSTLTKYRFTGLESAKRYYVCVAAYGTNSQCVYSEATHFVTQ